MQKISTIKNGLVPVYETNSGEKVVYGSELYRGVQPKSSYAEWIYKSFEECKAKEEEDYYVFLKNQTSKRASPKLEYLIKLDVAKRMTKESNDEKNR